MRQIIVLSDMSTYDGVAYVVELTKLGETVLDRDNDAKRLFVDGEANPNLISKIRCI